MAGLPGASYARPLDVFTTDVVMNTFLIVYIVAHLAAYVLLGVALLRVSAIPSWAGWSLIASSPLQILAFALPGSPRPIAGVALGLFLLGSIPPALAILSYPLTHEEEPGDRPPR
jgi:hypothetical protein